MPHKTCPGCQKPNGVRTHVCECGHQFQKGGKAAAKYIESPRPKVASVSERQTSVNEPRTNQFNSVGRILSNVVIPAGECPSPLPKEPTLDNLREWILEVSKPFDGRNQVLLPSAIYYFARTYFVDIRSVKLKLVERLLDQILIPAEEKGVLDG